MTNVSAIQDAAEAAAIPERRRPGRLAEVSPELLPLLRGQAMPDLAEQELQFGDPDQLRSARGLVVATAFSAALWACIAYIGRWILS